MLYFAYGSNLHHFQMKRRCKDSIFLKKINLKDFRLTFRSKYRAADIEPKKNSIVPGGLFEISKSDEKKLDVYEDFPILYKKYYFNYYGKEIMTYTMVKKTSFKFPTERYLNIVLKRIEDISGEKISDNIIFKKSFCVNDFIDDYNSYKGNAYGLANTLFQTSIFKPKMKSKKIKGLYFTGQLTVPGPGVPPSLISGKIVSDVVMQDFLY